MSAARRLLVTQGMTPRYYIYIGLYNINSFSHTCPSVSSLVKSVKAKAKSFTEHRKKLGTKRLKKRHL